MRLHTVGRRTGRERVVIVGYFEDGPDLVTMAMNGWGDGEPAWWLNLQAHPAATVDLAGGQREVIARAASGQERERLWALWAKIDKNLEAYAARRSMETAVVVLAPLASDAEALTRPAGAGGRDAGNPHAHRVHAPDGMGRER